MKETHLFFLITIIFCQNLWSIYEIHSASPLFNGLGKLFTVKNCNKFNVILPENRTLVQIGYSFPYGITEFSRQNISFGTEIYKLPSYFYIENFGSEIYREISAGSKVNIFDTDKIKITPGISFNCLITEVEKRYCINNDLNSHYYYNNKLIFSVNIFRLISYGDKKMSLYRNFIFRQNIILIIIL